MTPFWYTVLTSDFPGAAAFYGLQEDSPLVALALGLHRLVQLIEYIITWYTAAFRHSPLATLTVTLLVIAVVLWVIGYPTRRAK